MKLRVALPRLRLPASRRRLALNAAWCVSGGALVLAVFGLSLYVSMLSARRSTEIKVPELVGLDLEAADAQVEELGLVLQVVDQRHDPTVSSGRVVEQMPRGGSSVRRGRKVKLVLSLGGEVLEVPKLVGGTARTVEFDLRREGFSPGEVARVPSYDAPAGTVIGQVPPPATPAVPRTRVHRLVSDGPPAAAWVMPDLTGLALAEAERWMDAAGFRRGAVRRVRMVGRPSGTVVGQLPLAGYPIRRRDVVELTVAR